ncbi:hypothetical protein LUZ61_007847 [Rhynchospora tenuis]|uniref:Thioredoxin domain-containing protein n=1 Tax=Rhynchospora tenuis TaxID=198213 RepID=A0AAD6EWW0_9POAL|nr:hypothetical protein LUZ61_007847 [Rhynchospora tenuis]
MSHDQRPVSGLSSRLDIALSLEENKPDTKTFPDLGSPVSPLRSRTGGPANTSSSSSSSGSFSANRTLPGTRKSGELSSGSGESSPTGPRPVHRRSGSTGPLIYSGGSSSGHNSSGHTSGGASSGVGTGGSSTASSPMTNVLPAGNICPSGKIGRPGAVPPRTSTRSDVLGTGTGNYGHGSIMWGGSVHATNPNSSNFQEATKRGNEYYKRGLFLDALRLYDKAVSMSPDNASCRSNRAAALIGLGRIGEALRECEEAVRLDPTNGKAHHRLAGLNLRIGLVDNARKHFSLAAHGQPPDQTEMRKLQDIEGHSAKCIDARRIGDWKSTLREADATVSAGADSSPLIFALRAEALLKLHKLVEADSTLSGLAKLESSVPASSPVKVFGMISSSYIQIVRAQVDMALGRFDTAVAAAEKAKQLDPTNTEVTSLLNKVRLVAQARLHGNELFKSGSFADACTAYGEGLKHEPFNPVLYCNRAACWSKMGRWEKSVEDCNEALRIQPNYTKALLRRANSNAKLERWTDCVRDYEVLRKELPGDKEVAEGLFHAQVALKMSRGEEVSNLKFGGEVEAVSTLEQFQVAISLPGVSVVYFMAPGNAHCNQITPFVDVLCTRYPSANFLKVNVNESHAVARAENVRIVPTFKIYKNGTRVKEMICPSQQILEYSVRHYSL